MTNIDERAASFATQTVDTLIAFSSQDIKECKASNYDVTSKGLFVTWEKLHELISFSYRAAIELEKHV